MDFLSGIVSLTVVIKFCVVVSSEEGAGNVHPRLNGFLCLFETEFTIFGPDIGVGEDLLCESD